jgi:hypothetical protein
MWQTYALFAARFGIYKLYGRLTMDDGKKVVLLRKYNVVLPKLFNLIMNMSNAQQVRKGRRIIVERKPRFQIKS